MSDETPTPVPPARKKGMGTMVREATAEAVAEERRWAEVGSDHEKILALLEALSDERAIEFAKQESRQRKAEACTRIGENLTHPSALKYYAGIIVLLIGSYAGLSFSGYGVSVGAADCPTPAVVEDAVPSDAP